MPGNAPSGNECNTEGRRSNQQHGPRVTFWDPVGFRIALRMRLGENLDRADRPEGHQEEETAKAANNSRFHTKPSRAQLTITPRAYEWHGRATARLPE